MTNSTFNTNANVLTSSAKTFMNTFTDSETGEQVIVPTYETLVIPGRPDYIDGIRKNVNSFGTTDLSNFSGDTRDLIVEIGADFTASKVPAYRQIIQPNGEPKFVMVPNNFFVQRDDTHEILSGNVTETYKVFDFSDAVYYYMSILNQLGQRGYDITPAFGKVWGNGQKLFLQHKIKGGQVMGDPVDSYLTLLSSHDSTQGFVIALSCVRCFCSNQIHRMLKNAQMKLSLRHTTNNAARIESEAQKMIDMEQKASIALEEYAESLASMRMTEAQLFNAFARYKKLSSLKTQRQINNFETLAGGLISAYRMPDVDNFRNTALGGYYAFSDASQHITPLRLSASRDQKMIEAMSDGNMALGEFADILVQEVK